MTDLPGVDLEQLRQRKAELQAELRAIKQIEQAYARLRGRGAGGSAMGRGRGRPNERLGQVLAVLQKAGGPLSPDGIHAQLQAEGTGLAWADATKSMAELARRDRMREHLLVRDSDGRYGLAEWARQDAP